MGLIGGGIARAAGSARGPGRAGSWTVYHGDPAGTGVAVALRSVTTSVRAWTSPQLDGQIYGEPLMSGRLVYVATENDTVYALWAATGSVAWSAHVGAPVPASLLPCGNITPTVGITGTPVLDPSRAEIFAVADVLKQGRPSHILVGLNAASGRRELSQPVDPAGQDPAAILQRTGLTLDAGEVVFGFGGNYGDCGTYRGRLVAVPEAGGTPRVFTVDAAGDELKGAIWMGGAAPAVDGAGHIWVTTGNGSVRSPGHAYDHSDGLLELSPSLRLLQFFAPRDWASDNASDLDLSAEPVLLPAGQVIAAGKSGRVYLLDRARLGGVGGEQAALGSACGGDIDGGSARAGSTVYLPCGSGVVAIQARASPAGLRLLWTSRAGGGPPILAAGLVWTVGQDGVLYGLDPGNGAVRRHASIGKQANHFPTPSAGAGLLVATCADRVVAFRMAAAAGRHGSQPGRTASASAGCNYSAPGPAVPRREIAAVALAALATIAALGWLARRWLMNRRA